MSKEDIIDEVSVARYTFDAWRKCYPDLPEWEWERVNSPNNLLKFVWDTHEDIVANAAFNLSNNYEMTIVTIGDDYFEWLGDRKNTEELRLEYTNKVNNADAIRLADDSEMNYSYSVCLYPIYISQNELREKRRRILSEDVRLSFQNYLLQITPDADICVLPWCMDMLVAAENENEIIKHAQRYFSTGKIIDRIGWGITYNTRAYDVVMHCIPIVYREKHTSMVFNINDMFAASQGVLRNIDELCFDNEFFEVAGIQGVEQFIDTELSGKIRNDLKLICLPSEFEEFIVLVDDVQEYYNVLRGE